MALLLAPYNEAMRIGMGLVHATVLYVLYVFSVANLTKLQ
jgi:hypothetical protein